MGGSFEFGWYFCIWLVFVYLSGICVFEWNMNDIFVIILFSHMTLRIVKEHC